MWEYLNQLRDYLSQIFGNSSFLPHAICLVNPELIYLHLVSDALIAISYFSIPFSLTLYYFKRKHDRFPFHTILLFFIMFIVSCGITHVMGIWTLWFPNYYAQGIIKAWTAVASMGTAFIVHYLLPSALMIPGPESYKKLNLQLTNLNASLEESNSLLEARVAERTAELEKALARAESYNSQLQQSLNDRDKLVREKEILVREVHHRVKNNMTVFSSMANFHSRKIDDPKVKDIFRAMNDRLFAMKKVHERLESAQDLSILDIASFIQDLCSHFQLIYGKIRTVDYKIQISKNMSIRFDLATSLSILCSELISNAFKHGFEGEDKGTLIVKMTECDGGYCLSFINNGKNMPDSYSQGMGSILIEGAARQLGATITTDKPSSGAGVEIHVNLPEDVVFKGLSL